MRQGSRARWRGVVAAAAGVLGVEVDPVGRWALPGVGEAAGLEAEGVAAALGGSGRCRGRRSRRWPLILAIMGKFTKGDPLAADARRSKRFAWKGWMMTFLATVTAAMALTSSRKETTLVSVSCWRP